MKQLTVLQAPKNGFFRSRKIISQWTKQPHKCEFKAILFQEVALLYLFN